MRVWLRSNRQTDFGKNLLIWRHRAVNRFVGKIFSWLLGGFVMGLLASILLNGLGLGNHSLFAGRLVFFLVFIAGVISAIFHNLIYGLEFRITQKALLHVRPLFSFLSGGRPAERCHPFDRVEFIPWEEIKSVDESAGALAITLKQGYQLSLGVTPLLSLWTLAVNGVLEKHVPTAGIKKQDGKGDKEALKLIVQKIRDISKTATIKK